MNASSPLSTVQALYERFGRGDLPGLLAMLDDDVDWHFVADRGAPYRPCRGREAVGRWFGTVLEADDIRRFEPREFLAGGDSVTVLGWEQTVARPAGKAFECEWVHVWRLKDGRVTRFWGMLDTEAAAAARA